MEPVAALALQGCLHWPTSITPAAALDELLSECGGVGKPGQRYPCDSSFVALALQYMQPVADQCCPGAKPVRAVLFDKTPESNWVVPWHQDRTIAVKQRVDQDGFGPWSIKDGMQHVEPPFALLSHMVTLRLHLDACDEDNAPLKVAIGSHGRRVAAADASRLASSSEILTCIAAAGDIWAYATPILHRSDRAAVARRRRVLQIDFSPDTLPEGMEWLS